MLKDLNTTSPLVTAHASNSAPPLSKRSWSNTRPEQQQVDTFSKLFENVNKQYGGNNSRQYRGNYFEHLYHKRHYNNRYFNEEATDNKYRRLYEQLPPVSYGRFDRSAALEDFKIVETLHGQDDKKAERNPNDNRDLKFFSYKNP